MFGAALVVVAASLGAVGSASSQPSLSQPSVGAATLSGLTLKRRVAIGRFSNATQYGRALLLPGEKDPLADQAGDMLAARLVDTGKFIVLERPDMDAVKSEQSLIGTSPGAIIGADTLLVGSVTQFGRKLEGKSGFLNSQARQVASATVEIRLVDVRTGQAFFSTVGSGSATVEVSEVAGFGSRAAYDSTLNDKAISAAISDLMTNLMQKLQQRPWSTDILAVKTGTVMISGGSGEGLRIGDRLTVAHRGKVMISGQTGLPIELPAEPVASLQVTGFFGSGDAEGSVARIVDGAVDVGATDLIVMSQSR
ncbi:MAG TPA: CsgG/HfaB family protein [Caulobacteraceae bacterium]|jgi:curli biogenesis system outer membrane secretion channel CsgG|nr:CsgG/HfaB family protein [Caulobacteraceae bacterium]